MHWQSAVYRWSSWLNTACRLPICVVTATQDEADRFVEDISFYSKTAATAVLSFPSYNVMPFSFLSYHSETTARRIRALYQTVVAETPPIVVTTISAAVQKLIPKKLKLRLKRMN